MVMAIIIMVILIQIKNDLKPVLLDVVLAY